MAILNITCKTGDVTRYLSKNAFGAISYLRQVAKCWRIESMVWRGCWRVMRKYFWRGRARLGKIDWAASYESMGVEGPEITNEDF